MSSSLPDRARSYPEAIVKEVRQEREMCDRQLGVVEVKGEDTLNEGSSQHNVKLQAALYAQFSSSKEGRSAEGKTSEAQMKAALRCTITYGLHPRLLALINVAWLRYIDSCLQLADLKLQTDLS